MHSSGARFKKRAGVLERRKAKEIINCGEKDRLKKSKKGENLEKS